MALESDVLAAVLLLGENATAVTVRESLQDKRLRLPARGAVYTTLARLEEKGMVRSVMGDPTPIRGGRAQRYYGITATGRRALRADADMAALATKWWRAALGARR